MKFFEYHFNPKARQDIIIDTFCFQGTAWIFGVLKLKQALAQDRQLPSKLFLILQENYYQQSFFQALEAANDFLNRQKHQHILGNLEMALVCITRDLNFEISQTGDGTVLLQRAQEIFDLSYNLQKKPLGQGKIFSEVMSGTLQPNDRLLILTKGLAQILEQLHILQTLCQVKKPGYIKKIFKYKRPVLKQAFGACAIVQAKKPWLKIPKINLPPLCLPLKRYGLKKPFLSVIILTLILALGWLLFG